MSRRPERRRRQQPIQPGIQSPIIPTRDRVARRCRQDVIVDLKEGEVTVPCVLSLVGNMLSNASEHVALLTERVRKMGHPTPACQAGCSWCCYMEVFAGAPEVLRVAAYIREQFSLEEQAAARERVAARCTELDRERDSPCARLTTPCGMLVDGSCAVHPARPIRCAAWSSLDAEQCRRWHEWSGEGEPVAVTTFIPQSEIMVGTHAGLLEGLAALGYQAELLEFNRALAIALDNPDAGERWLAGEPVFASAQVRP
jgi:hypothetical protein